jgi:translation initiation factor 2 beta subunit (eIF-2beta)/eIF-5
MKKILTLVLFLITISGFSQTPDFPIYQFDSTHQIMTVVFSLKQAQTIDNDYEYLELLEKSRKGCDSLAKSYQIVIQDLGKVIAQQDVTINDLTKLNNQNKTLVDNLNEQIKKYIRDSALCDSIGKIKDDKIISLKKENLKLKVKNTGISIGLGTFGTISLGVAIYLGLKVAHVIP